MTKPMTIRSLGMLAVLTAVGTLISPVRAGEAEDKLIAQLAPGRGPTEKDAACQQLRRVGTAASVPALAGLLADANLSQSARLALEYIAGPEADAALRDAVAKTTGKTRAGIIDSIGQRRDAKAVAVLVEQLGGEDAFSAESAAVALGRIGGADAATGLGAALPKAAPSLALRLADGLLACAEQLAGKGDAQAAGVLYAAVYNHPQLAGANHVRAGAYRGMILAAGKDAAGLIEKGLIGDDNPALLASLAAVRTVQGAEATARLAGLLGKKDMSEDRQVALIAVLTQRGDKAAAPAMVERIVSGDRAVRVAALRAIGQMGDATAVPALAKLAATTTGPDQGAARRALAALPGVGPSAAMVDLLAGAEPALRAELVLALGERCDRSAAPKLLQLARGNDAAMRSICIRALDRLADVPTACGMLDLLAIADNDDVRGAIERTIVSAGRRTTQPDALVERILAAMKDARADVRCALVRVAAAVGSDPALKAVVAETASADAAVADMAVRALAGCEDPAARGELLALAGRTANPTHRVLVMRGYWRLVSKTPLTPPVPPAVMVEQLRQCREGLAACSQPEEKKLGLAALGAVASEDAFKMAESYCTDEAIRAEAESAIVRIAGALVKAGRTDLRPTIEKLAAEAIQAPTREEARKTIESLDQFTGFVDAWKVAGPFRQEGKDATALFDIAFAPEQDPAEADWKPIAMDKAANWRVDLLPVSGASNSTVYVKTRIQSPAAQKAQLRIGSDDGVKVWFNGKVVYGKNVVRGLAAGSDSVAVELKEGWNDIMLKITQSSSGCAACMRVVTPTGATMKNLKFAAE